MVEQLMRVEDLTLIDGHTNHVLVHHFNLTLHRGEVIAIIGESGSGKSMTCKALLGLNDRNIRMSGEIWFQKRRFIMRLKRTFEKSEADVLQ